jgi:rhomboid family GlyGly-CTERM serine protease
MAVLAQTDASVSQYLASDRTAIQAGEIWRLVTGHFTHWSVDHLLWDLLMFITLGMIIENRDRTGFLVTLVASMMAISAVLWFCQPTIGQYRGLSGIDSALFTHAALLLYVSAHQANRRVVRGLIALALVGFAAKVAFEVFTGNTLFVDSAASGFVPLAIVHAVGGVVGAVSAICMWRSVSRRPSSSDRGSNPKSLRALALLAR